MPITLPFSSAGSILDTELFDVLNPVVLGYGCLIFLPRWKHTHTVVFTLIFVYSVLYTLLLVNRLVAGPLPQGSGFDSLAGVTALFSDEAVIFAGWTHYIAFDLLASSFIVSDAIKSGLPHLSIVWTIPLTLMAGPIGLTAYMLTKTFWLRAFGSSTTNEITFMQCKLNELQNNVVSSPTLTLLYCGVSGLALFMVVWVVAMPSSWYANRLRPGGRKCGIGTEN